MICHLELFTYPVGQMKPGNLKYSQNQCLTQGKAGWFKEVLYNQRNTAGGLSENYISGKWTQLRVFRVDEGGKKGLACVVTDNYGSCSQW